MLTIPSTPPLLYPEQPFLAQVRACILNNLDDESFGVAELAGAVFLSRAQLFRKVRALSGRNPARYIHLVRIEQAKVLLLLPGLTVSEVAWRTGFSDPSYLRRVFLRETGERLGEYRRRCGEGRMKE
ncbi:MAG: helix-turn-helix transcriptional regulator [Phaeodactylibacter sp.]|nr:helix-turn-helix transcriptional regulator [Phaeodactylibacter sp.]